MNCVAGLTSFVQVDTELSSVSVQGLLFARN